MRRISVLGLLALTACNLPDGSLPPAVHLYGSTSQVTAANINHVRLVVLGKDGAPTAQSTIQLSLDSGARFLGLKLAAPPDTTHRDTISVQTDGTGIAQIDIITASRPGHGAILVTGPGVEDSVVFEFTPSPPRRVTLSQVLPLHVGDSANVTWAVTDSSFQSAFGDVTLSVDDPAVATLVHQAFIQGIATGATWVRATSATGAKDSAYVAVVPPGGLGALFNGNGAWYEFDLHGTPRTFVFNSGLGFGGPRYSPTTDTLAFAQAGHIHVRLPSGNVIPVVPAALGFSGDGDPEWSADGQWLYFTAAYPSGTRYEIWKIHPDGTGAVRVGPLAANGQIDVQPTINPAGTVLGFTTNRTSPGSALLQLVDATTLAIIYQGPPASFPLFSPDGQKVAFLTTGGALAIVNADGTGLHTLASLTNIQGQLTWSPDSRWIAAQSGNYLFVIDVVADKAIRLPFSLAFTTPAWR